MSTGIPISADSSMAVAAIEQISAAIRKSGQEGLKFSKLDLSHPELEGMADDLKRLQSNFTTMKSFKGVSGTAKKVDEGNYSDVMDWLKNHGRQFSNEDARRQHFATVGNYFTHGSRWNPAPPGGSPPGGNQSGGGLGSRDRKSVV